MWGGRCYQHLCDALSSPLVSVRGRSPHHSGFPFSDCHCCNRMCGLMECWGRGAWRDKPAPLGVLLALSLQPLMVRSLFALCNGADLVFVAWGSSCSPLVSFGPISSSSKCWILLHYLGVMKAQIAFFLREMRRKSRKYTMFYLITILGYLGAVGRLYTTENAR